MLVLCLCVLGSLTGVCAEVSCECVTAAAGIVTEGTFKGLFTRMELDVAQQVALLREGRAALVTLEWPLTYQPFFTAKSPRLITPLGTCYQKSRNKLT